LQHAPPFPKESGVVTLPNFIVIGAAKAGTTALYWYLAEHPDVFMSPVKETNYFAYGVDERGELLFGDPEVHRFPIRTLPDYEALFADSGSAHAVGEASTMYLECPQAAGRIRRLLPDARIICGLREPVDRAYSDYQMYLRNRSRRLDAVRDLSPGAAWARPDSHWMRIGRYHDALARYYEAFPREQIHVFLFDDLKRNALQVVQNIYRFLGTDPGFVPDFDTPHNVGGMPSSVMLERVFTSKTIKAAVEPWVPKGAANWLRRLRTRSMQRPPALPTELQRELRAHFREDIARTSALIGRSLDHWTQGG
jgi:Sulfotransferase family